MTLISGRDGWDRDADVRAALLRRRLLLRRSDVDRDGGEADDDRER